MSEEPSARRGPDMSEEPHDQFMYVTMIVRVSERASDNPSLFAEFHDEVTGRSERQFFPIYNKDVGYIKCMGEKIVGLMRPPK